MNILTYLQTIGWKNVVIFILTEIVVILIMFRPTNQPPDSSGPYRERINKLEVQDAQKDATINALKKEYKDSLKVFESIVGAQESEIRRLKKKATASVNDIPLLVLEDYPEVPAALAAKDSVISSLETQNEDLTAALQFSKKAFEELSKLTVDKDLIADEMIAARDVRIHELKKMNERTFKKKTFWKKATGVLAVAVVVETLILAIQ